MSKTRWMGFISRQVIKGRPENISQCTAEWGRRLGRHSIVKAEVLNIFFTSVLTSKTSLQASRLQKPQGKSGARNVCPWWKRIRLQILNQIMHLRGLMGWELRELVDVLNRQFLTILEWSWQLGEVPDKWRKGSFTPNFWKGRKESMEL